ncbi:cobalamin-binding protein [uncultured Shewanella sp.]|uniref:cobalamin-binding protein n=1 Tax=uncultured Shewanella sp. TaxID=173975 RepID=UPI002622F65A|nr:cobalamin-binding protein [uncultured Shewanella sp.]
MNKTIVHSIPWLGYGLIVGLLALFSSYSAVAASAKQPAKRVVALSPHAVEILFAIGAGGTIVGTVDSSDYPEAAKNIPRVGGYYGLQLEKIIELAPDLIVTWQGGSNQEALTRLSDLGFDLVNSDPQTLMGVADDIERLGELTGHTKKAHQVAMDYRHRLALLKAENADKKDISVFYQLWSTPLMTVAKGSWIQQIIAVCHGKNIFYDAKNEYPQVSIESVLLKAPQVILQSQDEGNIMGVDWSRWPEIPAVKNKHIYQLNADLLHRPSPRTIQGVSLLCGALDKARIKG